MTRNQKLLFWTLRLTVLLQCVGYFAHASAGETAIFELLWIEADLSEAVALGISNAGAWYLLLAGLLSLSIAPRWLLYPVSAWFFATAAAETWMMGGRFFYTAIPAHAVRIAAPVALAWFSRCQTVPVWSQAETACRRTERLLAGAAGLTFLAHGWEALQHHPRFADYILMASDRLLDWRFEQSTVLAMLTVIGIVDVVVALVAFLGRRRMGRVWRPLVAWMAFWACTAAFARVMHAGWGSYYKVLIRTANFGLPLALFWMSWVMERRSDDDRGSDDESSE